MPLKSFATRLYLHARQDGLKATRRYLHHVFSEKYHEARLGINTRGYLDAKQIGIDSFTSEYNEYEPISYSSIFTALNFLTIDPNQDVFFDYGCGKGRALVTAATYPFKKVLGVELSLSLADIARNNLKKARNLRCKQIEVITADATHYQLPDDVTIVLMYAPFVGEVLTQVIAKIMQSLERQPRALKILYKYPDWAKDPYENLENFSLQQELILYSEAGEKLRIYQWLQGTT